TAVAAIKRGAYDFIEKPFKADRLVLVADRSLETSRLKREVKELKQLAPVSTALVGRSPVMNQLRQTIEKAAPTNSRILIVGPFGSGKELAARTIHTLSARANGPFVLLPAAATRPHPRAVPRRRQVPRGSLSPPLGRPDPRTAPGRAARGHSRPHPPFHGADFAGDRPAATPDRRGRCCRAAIARLARQRTTAAQQHRTANDPRWRRSERG